MLVHMHNSVSLVYVQPYITEWQSQSRSWIYWYLLEGPNIPFPNHNFPADYLFKPLFHDTIETWGKDVFFEKGAHVAQAGLEF